MNIITDPSVDSEFVFSASPVYSQSQQSVVVSSGGQSSVISEDVVFTRNSGAVVDHNVQISWDQFGTYAFESKDPSIATVNNTGYVERVSNGTARIIANKAGDRRLLSVSVSRESGQTIDTFDTWKNGSLAKHASSNVDDKITSLTPSGATLDIFAIIDHAGKRYTYNSGLWVGRMRKYLTATSVWSSVYANSFPVTMITPRHGICVNHVGVQVGTVLRFAGYDQQVIERTVIQIKELENVTNDARLVLLNSSLPSSIYPVKVLPSFIEDYLPNVEYGIPALVRMQNQRAVILDLIAINSSLMSFEFPKDPKRYSFSGSVQSGDSGQPSFLLIGDALCLNTIWSYVHRGVSYHVFNWQELISQIDAQANINTGLIPQIANLSNFESY